jgi:hypothetical protein
MLDIATILAEDDPAYNAGAGLGWVDLGRRFAGEVPGPYTWWSQRGQAFDTDTGWRIDYHQAKSTLAAAVRSIRAGEKSSHKQSKIRDSAANALGSLPRTTANETMDLLAIYVEKQQALSIGYADNNGAVSHRIVDPIKISAGALVARDHATGEMQSFRIPRITGVAPL